MTKNDDLRYDNKTNNYGPIAVEQIISALNWRRAEAVSSVTAEHVD